MTSARLHVLDMLADQSISVTEATRLLRAIAVTIREADHRSKPATIVPVAPYSPLPWTEQYHSLIKDM